MTSRFECHSERRCGHKRRPLLAARAASESRNLYFLCCALISVLLCAPCWCQVATRVPRVIVRDVTFHSASLARDMKYRVILPADYPTSSRRYPVLYLLHGLTGHYQDWESRTHLDEDVANLPLIVAMPEGDDSWYANSASQPQEKWEDYIVKDFIAEIDSRYRTIQARQGRAIAGLSMGGYGALKFAMKYPAMFIFAASFSGVQNIARDPQLDIGFGPKYQQQIADIFGPGGAPSRAANDVFELARQRFPSSLPFLFVSCGADDRYLSSNRELVAVLQQQKIPYEYRESPGGHSWKYWDEQLPYTLSLLMDRYFREPKLPASKAPTAKH